MNIRQLTLPLLLVIAGCGGAEGRPVGGNSGVALSRAQDLPDQLGFGQPATAQHIAAVGPAVQADGRGLPAGRGTPEQGAPIYAAECASCHGAAGEGGSGGVLVGRLPGDAFNFADTREGERLKTIGSYWPQAPSLFSYIKRAMPANNPGSLTDEEVYALTAHLLHLNQLIPAGAVIDATTLPQVVMPARDNFVMDNREETPSIR